jgi:hypothetical protein
MGLEPTFNTECAQTLLASGVRLPEAEVKSARRPPFFCRNGFATT